jgi:hypothetical protein
MAQSDSRRKALTGLFGGVLAIPALALASSALFASTDPEAEAADEQAAATASAEVIAQPAPSDAGVTATARDLRRACGTDGQALVDAEAAGTIGAVEQAALDALRPICDAEGRPLAGPPSPEPVVVAAAQTNVTSVSFDDDHDDGDDDDTPADDSWDDDSASWDTPDDSPDDGDE